MYASRIYASRSTKTIHDKLVPATQVARKVAVALPSSADRSNNGEGMLRILLLHLLRTGVSSFRRTLLGLMPKIDPNRRWFFLSASISHSLLGNFLGYICCLVYLGSRHRALYHEEMSPSFDANLCRQIKDSVLY